MSTPIPRLPAGQQWVAPRNWPPMGERAPRVDDSPWKVQVQGRVAQPLSIGLGELLAMPQQQQTIDIHCVTRWSKPAVRFGGVPLSALVARAVPDDSARFVSFVARSAREHSTSLVLADALSLGALVALTADGEPLPQERGGPVRLVVPRRYFYKSLKWLERIELLETDRLGYWEATAGYHNTADPWREQRYMAGEISPNELRSMLATRDVSGRSLRSLNARGHDLAGLQASDALLRDADFRDCRLSGAVFDGANLTNARFQGANLDGASFRDADLEGANFSGANLSGANLAAGSLLAVSFCEVSASAESADGATFDANTVVTAALVEGLTPLQQAYVRDALVRVAQGS
jgi:hypothetical protein